MRQNLLNTEHTFNVYVRLQLSKRNTTSNMSTNDACVAHDKFDNMALIRVRVVTRTRVRFDLEQNGLGNKSNIFLVFSLGALPARVSFRAHPSNHVLPPAPLPSCPPCVVEECCS